jgi:hypothetical protein
MPSLMKPVTTKPIDVLWSYVFGGRIYIETPTDKGHDWLKSLHTAHAVGTELDATVAKTLLQSAKGLVVAEEEMQWMSSNLQVNVKPAS